VLLCLRKETEPVSEILRIYRELDGGQSKKKKKDRKKERKKRILLSV